jgi:hypothetical protein
MSVLPRGLHMRCKALLSHREAFIRQTTTHLPRRLCPSVTRNCSLIWLLPDYNELIFPKGLVSVASRSTTRFVT